MENKATVSTGSHLLMNSIWNAHGLADDPTSTGMTNKEILVEDPYRGMPQGAPTSCSLATLALLPLEAETYSGLHGRNLFIPSLIREEGEDNGVRKRRLASGEL